MNRRKIASVYLSKHIIVPTLFTPGTNITSNTTTSPAIHLVIADPDNGGFYFTSPYESRNEPRGRLYYVNSLGEAHLISDGLGYGNGVVLRPGGKELLVGESLFNRILEFPVLSPGKLGAPRVFAYLPKPESGPAL